jgi:ATP-dependent Clp protease ATP-binding subunit ClpA
MTIALDSLIKDVEEHSPSREPLDLLATASSTVQEMTETADALLSHFVDRSRRAGHSWAEIGTALGVTKQAVQKRFTPTVEEMRNPPGLGLFTDRMRNVVGKHAERAARELGQPSIGTEALLLAFWGESKGLAAAALESLGVTRQRALVAISAASSDGAMFVGGYTPRAWAAMQSCLRVAMAMGHNYIGTEHLLLALLGGVGGVADEALTSLGVTEEAVAAFVVKKLKG